MFYFICLYRHIRDGNVLLFLYCTGINSAKIPFVFKLITEVDTCPNMTAYRSKTSLQTLCIISFCNYPATKVVETAFMFPTFFIHIAIQAIL